MRGLYFISLLLISCSSSKRLTFKENMAVKHSDSSQTINLPFVSSLELPLDTSDQHIAPKRYTLQSGETKIVADIRGKTLKLTASNDKQVGKDSLIEKVVTKDKLIYKDKLVKAPYIPKWVYIIITANVAFAGVEAKAVYALLGLTGIDLYRFYK